MSTTCTSRTSQSTYCDVVRSRVYVTDMSVADQVEMLIPVPDPLYEPGLLQTAAVDPAFAEAIEEFEANRAKYLSRRELVRRRYDRLLESVSGRALSWPAREFPSGSLTNWGRTDWSCSKPRRS